MIIHIVQVGDTLYNIAQRYGVSAQRVMGDNDLSSDRLILGQALIITQPEETYTVNAGDTIYSIAQNFGMTPIELMQNNPSLIANPNVYPGQVLTISFIGGKTRTITTLGYSYPFINRTVLRRALPYLTYIYIFSYGYTLNGELINVDDTEIISISYDYGTAPVMVLTSIDEGGSFSTDRASLLFNDIELQNKVLDNIIEVMQNKGYVGLNIDFEFIDPSDGQSFLGFLGNAHARLSENGFFLVTALAPKTSANQPGLLYEAHNYEIIGNLSDQVFLMTYEWGYKYDSLRYG